MLFDLQGKRRRAVQVTYLTLAILMGGGLVLFGIGGEVAGGLVDAFTQSDPGAGGDDEAREEARREAEEAFSKNPGDAEAAESLIQLHLNNAIAAADPQSQTFNARGRSELFQATEVYDRYLGTRPDPVSADVAETIVEVYGLIGEYKKAQAAAEAVAAEDPSVDAWLEVVRYAAWAKDEKSARKAGDKAIALAAEDTLQQTKREVRQRLKSKPPPQAPAEPPPGGEGTSPFEQPGQSPGGGAPPGQPPGGGAPAPAPGGQP
jgi:tetratricopeptide (TPR) repeat protein